MKKSIKKICTLKYLDKKQIKRLYDVFDFEENETITSATLKLDNKKLSIMYIDKDNIYGEYLPSLDMNNIEDIKKLDYIMNGEK